MGLTLSRVAIILMVLTLGRVAVNGLMMGNIVVAAAAAIATAAFASNWPIDLSRRAGRFAQRHSAWIVVITTFFVVWKAVAEGYRVYRAG